MNSGKVNSRSIEELTATVKQAIQSDRTSEAKQKMRAGEEYYNHQHDILNYRLFYVDNEGEIREEKTRSNIKIVHSYFTELVDQKVQYLLSNPVAFHTEDEQFKRLLTHYLDEDFQLMLQEMVEGASKKGCEYVYYFKTIDKVCFKIADSLKLIEVYNDDHELMYMIRYYDTTIYQEDHWVKVTKAELWDREQTWFFVSQDGTAGKLIVDDSVPLNPRPHELLINHESGEALKKGYGFIPFLRLDNNRSKTTDLEPIKQLMDDYDLMACALSNNLQDFDQPFFAVKGFDGDSYNTLLTNLKARGAVGVGEHGGLDVHTIDIPVDARKEKLRIDKEGIYKFGMGFDSSQVGDGNVTNVVIKSRYSLLDLKCNKMEIRLKKIIREMLELIVADMNQRHQTAYDARAIEIEITRDTMINEQEVAEIEKVEEEVKQLKMNNLLNAASRIDDQTVLKKLCDILEVDYQVVKDQLALTKEAQAIDSEVSSAAQELVE